MKLHDRVLGKVKISISDACAGSGQCVLLASAVFRLDDGGYSEFVDSELGDELLDSVRQAAMACPTGAITLAEGDELRRPV